MGPPNCAANNLQRKPLCCIKAIAGEIHFVTKIRYIAMIAEVGKVESRLSFSFWERVVKAVSLKHAASKARCNKCMHHCTQAKAKAEGKFHKNAQRNVQELHPVE